MRRIFINGNIITENKLNPRSDAFIVEDNLIKEVGTEKEIESCIKDGDEVIDLKGKTVVPGFNDSHVHLLNYGYSLSKIDCAKVDSIEEVIEMSKKYIADNNIPAGTWVSGRGWNEVFFKENRALTRYDLDRISTVHPIVFTRVCEHMVVVNSKGLEVAGITENTCNPEGGQIEKDKNNNLTGMLKETARYMIYEIVPNKSIEEIKFMLLSAMNEALSYGVTSVQTDDFETFSDKDWRKIIKAYRELIDEGKLNIRVYEQCLFPEINRLKEFISEGNVTGKGDEWFKIGPLKLLTDGSLGGWTAYLTAPYNDRPDTKGIPVFTQNELDELILTAHMNNMQIVCHAIGDGAMYMVFESFEKAQRAKLNQNARMGMIHVQITDNEILKKFKENNVLAYIEPICLNSDLHIAENRVGVNRAKTSYKYRSFYDMGVKVPISSDCPVDSLNPINNIYVGVNRSDYKGYPNEGWMSEECMTVEQMLEGFTMMSAYASFEENVKGSIEKGKLADFVILSQDITQIDTQKIRDIFVEKTYVGGAEVYSTDNMRKN